MTRTRLVLCLALIGTMGACGGRNGLRVSRGDGGSVGDGGTAGRFDGGLRSDAKLDGGMTDARAEVGVSDARIEVGISDVRVAEAAPEVRAEAGRLDVGRDVASAEGSRAEVGGPDVPRDGAIDVPVTDGRLDVSTPTDASRDSTTDRVAVTLSSIEISSSSSPIVVNVGTPVPFTVTAIYSDSTRQAVTSSATVTSSNTAVLTISGSNLVGAGTATATATITATYQSQTATAPVTVVGNNPLKSISIDQVPTSPLAVGQTVNLVATGVFADASKQDVTAQATWTSSAATVATVGNTGTTKGQVTGVAAGSFTVTATVGTIVGTSAQMTVNATKKLVSIQITPSQPTMQVRRTQAFVATGTYDDNSYSDVTQQATWSSSAASILTVVATGANAGQASAVAAGPATLTATLGAISGTDQVTVTAAVLRTITVTCPDVIIVTNPQSCSALGTYNDNTTADLTAQVTWSSSNTAALTMSNAAANPGLATGIAAGTATVRAALSGVTGQANVTVSAAPLISITVSPVALNNVIVGLTSSLAATGLYGVAGNPATQFSIDVTTMASWSVLDNTVATVGNSSTTAGQVTGVKAGSTSVTATLSGKTGQATVNVVATQLVSIAVSPPTASVRAGQTYPFQATGTFDNTTTRNITTDVTWTSSDATIATISNAAGSNGVATGVAASSTVVTITATMQGKQGTALLTVTERRLVSIQIAPSAAQTINVGDTQPYTVTGVYENGTETTTLAGVVWQSSNTAVATVAANPGGRGGAAAGATARGVAAGTTNITASYTPAGGSALTDSVSLGVIRQPLPIGIRLNNPNASIQVGDTEAYTAYLDYDDGTSAVLATGVTLTTSNGVVASVVTGGRGGPGGLLQVTGQAAGTVTVTASYTTNGQTYTYPTQLTVTAVPTTTQIGLRIQPTSASVKVNGTYQFHAYATYDNGTETEVTNTTGCAWTTSDGTLATVTTAGNVGGRGAIFGGGAGGLATGLAAGTPTINAIYGGFSVTAQLTVTAPVLQSLTVTGPANSLHVGQSQTYAATASYDDGTSATVTGSATWTTSDANIAVVSTSGGAGRGGPGAVVGGSTVTALAVGSVSINASYTENGVTKAGSALLTVNTVSITEFHITPTLPTIHMAIGNTLPFLAQVIYSDNSVATVTASTNWTSSAGAVAVISDSGATTGRATGLTAGTTTIAGTFQGSTDSTTLTVSAATPTGLAVTPTNPTMHLGINQPFAAVVTLGDNYTQTVTTSAIWTSSDNTVVSVGATTGVATPVKGGGPVTITATYQGLSGISVSGTSKVTVSSAALGSIDITPNPLGVVVGGHQQLTATGSWADTPPTTADITNNVTWLVSSADGGATTSATVSNATGSRGYLTGVSAGSVTVSAVFQTVTGTLPGTVTTSP
ncbi:MAG TPA: Ig-like domain-containing protein [Polyangia bacterium]|nr:Ig-like domain-containing protein [Polyangia bacterium]